MKRGILIGSGVVVLAIVGGVFYVLSSLDTLIKDAVETYGSDVTKAEVKLAEVDLDLTSGKGALRGLMVGNPEGFETPSAFQLGAISVMVDIGATSGDKIVITEIVIDKPDVTYELGGGGSNIDAIQKNVDAYMAQFGGGGGKPAAKKDAAGEGPKLIIENLYVRGGTVNVSATILAGKTMTAPLPDIHLKDIGKEDDGASPAEVANEVLTSISDGATKAVAGLGIGKTLDSLKQSLEGATKGGTDALKKSVEGATGSIKEGAGAVGGKIKGLFGK